MATFNSIHDLANSTDFDTKMSYLFFIGLLDSIFGKHDEITVNEDCETHQEFIKNHWPIINNLYTVPSATKSAKKAVRQTLKNIIEYLNSHYQLQQPIEFKSQKKGVRIGDKTQSIYYTNINLVAKI
jgi:hypothetical protein